MASRNLNRAGQIWKNACRMFSPAITSQRGLPHHCNFRNENCESFLREYSCWLHGNARYIRTDCRSRESRRSLTTTSNVKIYGEEWPEHDFAEVAEASLELVSEQVSKIGYASENAPPDFDIELSQGVLTISLGSSGTYVINTQTPNRQIWMSSPSSGPWRYAWSPQQKAWVSTRDGHMLNNRLTEELSNVFKESVLISFTDVCAG